MDVAASEFYKEGKYDLDFKNPKSDPSKVSRDLFQWKSQRWCLCLLFIIALPWL